MPRGLRGLARAVAGVAGTCLVAVVAAGLTAFATDAVATATAQAASWSVTVADASRALYPGSDATMAYDVRNTASAPEHLSGTTAEIRSDEPGCDGAWFRVARNDVDGGDVPAGATVHGVLTLVFDGAATSQDACQNRGIQVVVTAR